MVEQHGDDAWQGHSQSRGVPERGAPERVHSVHRNAEILKESTHNGQSLHNVFTRKVKKRFSILETTKYRIC